MPTPVSSFLEVAGARLYYETYGLGPLLVMIAGAAGSVEPYRPFAAQLASRYTTVTYDRRGFSRSPLHGDQDYGRRLEADASDVSALINHLGGEPSIVFGNSSGAIVALEALVRHPSAVRIVVAHEPPALMELVDGQQWLEFFSSVYDLYRKSGPGPAMALFRERSFPAVDRQVMAQVPANEFTAANSRHWFEHELRQYPAAILNHQALRHHADKILLAVGQESRGYPCYEVAVALGGRLGRAPVELPGGHLGFVEQAGAFARTLEPYLADTPLANDSG